MFPNILNQPLTIQPRGLGTPDAYGNEVMVPVGPPVATTGYLEQRTSAEFLVNRDTVVSNWWAVLPPDAVINHKDYITFQSVIYEVIGEPEFKWNPRTGSIHHIEARLVVIQG